MSQTLYTAEAGNLGSIVATGSGFKNGQEAQRWAETLLPDACTLVLRTKEGQARGWYRRPGGVGEWIDKDPWAKSV